jgi:peptidyl-dipeptidase Dcp
MRSLIPLTALVCLAAPAMAKPAPNPFFTPWKTPFAVPPFEAIKAEHFLPAFEEGMKRQKAEIAAITKNPAKPTFKNTVAALDDSGELLGRVGNVFGLLSSAETTEALQAVEAKVRPMLAGHADDIFLNETLFQRVKAVYNQRAALKLNPEEATLLEKTYRRFLRGGAELQGAKKDRLRAVNAELQSLIVKFGDNLLKETNAYQLVVADKAQLAGLPEDQLHAAAEVAKKAGLDGKWVFTLKAPSIWPFLQSAENRSLRQQILTAYATRCDKGGETDNKAVFAKLAALRVEKAQLLGYKTWGHYVLDENMAKTPDKAYALLEQTWKPSLALAKREAADLQAMMDKETTGAERLPEGGAPGTARIKLEPWDWRFYSEKVKKAKFDLDEEALKPYFPIDRVREGAFTLAHKLYGITFTERQDLPKYHPEIHTFEVKEKNGKHLGVLYMDFHPRPGKRGGAWCSSLQEQWIKNGKFVAPVVYNVSNFARPAGNAPALLTPDEAETLFHEFGHALHALFSSCRFRGSGNVAQDFVELPSQVMENWVFEPEMLKLYAKHYQTGEVIPEALVQKLKKAGTFNQGFAWTEKLAASFLDMDWHTLTDATLQDATAFEKASLAKWGLIPEILPRYRTPYFAHAADEYAAGYYSYTWSEVLDSDAFQAFKEKGDLFHPATAKAFRKLLSKGGSEDPAAIYREFRGRDPKVEALLEKRGLK